MTSDHIDIELVSNINELLLLVKPSFREPLVEAVNGSLLTVRNDLLKALSGWNESETVH